MAWQLTVKGQVQGVGFRPAVWQVANRLGLKGFVQNSGQGVVIALLAERDVVDHFVAELEINLPLLARIEQLDYQYIDFSTEAASVKGMLICDGFEIRASDQGKVQTGCTPDMATCPECLEEIRDPSQRRYGYAFTNCTHCGPRLSIVNGIPYDRSVTSMADFNMCAACQEEYDNPADRRFHAQPIACPDCGPQLALIANQGLINNPGDSDKRGEPLKLEQANIIAKTAALLKTGAIVAIKGLGGFHLACDANNAQAVAELRLRKFRPHKPFALMVKDRQQAERLCLINDEQWQLLSSPQAPVVLLDRIGSQSQSVSQGDQTVNGLAECVAPGQNRLGLMLPNTPLHHLLFDLLDVPLVMTSGNASGEPQAIDNQEALDTLSGIAGYFLLHNRRIENRVDDAVIQCLDFDQGQVRNKRTDTKPLEGSNSMSENSFQVIRRGRGYAPSAIVLPDGFSQSSDTLNSNPGVSGATDSDNILRDIRDTKILALGAELKNTFCLLSDGRATLSNHMGDLESARTFDQYQQGIERFLDLYQFDVGYLACDYHPEYLSSKYAQPLSEQLTVPIESVLHHHAHVAACLVDNLYPLDGSPVLAIALDGLGMGQSVEVFEEGLGESNELWGGELLLADYHHCQKLGGLKALALPGGAKAMQEPWRNLLALLSTASKEEYSAYLSLPVFVDKPVHLVLQMIEKGLNAPVASSCGRLFDAFAAALNLHSGSISYEGQAAIALQVLAEEQLKTQGSDIGDIKPLSFALSDGDDWTEAIREEASGKSDSENSPVSSIDALPALLELLQRQRQGESSGRLAWAFHKGLVLAWVQLVQKQLSTHQHSVRHLVFTGGVCQNRLLIKLFEQQFAEQLPELTLFQHHNIPANDGGIALGQAVITAARRIAEKEMI